MSFAALALVVHFMRVKLTTERAVRRAKTQHSRLLSLQTSGTHRCHNSYFVLRRDRDTATIFKVKM